LLYGTWRNFELFRKLTKARAAKVMLDNQFAIGRSQLTQQAFDKSQMGDTHRAFFAAKAATFIGIDFIKFPRRERTPSRLFAALCDHCPRDL
jgi:histidinol phosphatase-like enzyme